MAFERVMRKEIPYCRCVLIPLGSRYGVLAHLSALSSEEILLVAIDAGALPFKNDIHLMSLETTRPKAYSYRRLGIFIWRNRQYLLKHPAPEDIECVYMRRIFRALLDPFKAKVDFDAFRRPFPRELRYNESLSTLFDV